MRPPSHEDFVQRVRRYRRTEVVLATARLNVQCERAWLAGIDPTPGDPNYVQQYTIAGVARAALVAGNDHRDQSFSVENLIQLCGYYANVLEDRSIGPGDPAWFRMVMHRVAYEQFWWQRPPREGLARTVALLIDHWDVQDDPPSPSDWEQTLGMSLEAFVGLALVLNGAVLAAGGAFSRADLERDDFEHALRPFGVAAFFDVVNRWFSATLAELRAAGMSHEVHGLERWALSPLVERPIVALPDGQYVSPWSRLILDRVSSTGIYFVGLEAFGDSFLDSLGPKFERYVGAQLRLLKHATVLSEIVYGPHGERTVDFFVITPETVVLVEAKAARPILATRLGTPAGDEDIVKKVGGAFKQIARTAELLQQNHPALGEIPADREIRGLLVTLEPFHLLNMAWFDDTGASVFDPYSDILERPVIPTAVESAADLEAVTSELADSLAVGSRFLDALTPRQGENVTLRRAGSDGTSTDDVASRRWNPLLQGAFNRAKACWPGFEDDATEAVLSDVPPGPGTPA